MPFELASDYSPEGDQAQAIAKLTKSILAGHRHQTLLGVTGSGKTFTAANARPVPSPALRHRRPAGTFQPCRLPLPARKV